MSKTDIQWSQAIQLQKEEKQQRELQQKEYNENLQLASREVWDAMGSEMFCNSDVVDIAMQYGVDEEDLIFSLI